MKRILFSGILLFLVFSLFGQNQPDSIVIKKGLAVTFKLNGKNLKPKQLSSIFKSNPEANIEMKIARKNRGASIPFIVLGVPSILITPKLYSATGVFSWPLLGVGIGLSTIGFCFSNGYIKHAIKAGRIYNKGLKYSTGPAPDIRFGFNQNSVGFKISF